MNCDICTLHNDEWNAEIVDHALVDFTSPAQHLHYGSPHSLVAIETVSGKTCFWCFPECYTFDQSGREANSYTSFVELLKIRCANEMFGCNHCDSSTKLCWWRLDCVERSEVLWVKPYVTKLPSRPTINAVLLLKAIENCCEDGQHKYVCACLLRDFKHMAVECLLNELLVEAKA